MAYGMGSSNFNTPMGVAGKPKGLFGKLIRNPLEGTGVVQHTPQERINQQPTPEQQKPGFFDKGGASQYVFAGLQDFLQRRMGEQPTGVSNLMQRQMAEQQAVAQASQAQLQRAQELADFETKEGIKAKYEVPGIQQNADYIRRTQGDDAADNYIANYGRAPVQPTAVNMPGLGSFYGTPEQVSASIAAAMGRSAPQGGGSIPRVTDEASYNSLPAGSKFYDDEGNLRTKAGGPTQPASGGF